MRLSFKHRRKMNKNKTSMNKGNINSNKKRMILT